MLLSRLLTFILLICISSISAQLPDGSVVPDWTLTDLEGNTHHLYEELDAKKSVIIDFSATWCGNCWNYHQTHTLDNIYESYGPDGTDVLRVYWIDADANTNDACVTNSFGCNSSTIGDWTADSAHPYFNLIGDDLQVKTDYSISSFPTIIGIAPNRKMYEIGKLTDLNTWDSWINETFALDYSAVIGLDKIELELIAGYGDINYEWSNGATTKDIIDIDPGSYSCTITEGRGHSIETINFEVTGTVFSISCPQNLEAICEGSEAISYTSIDEFQEAGGIIGGNFVGSSFLLQSESSDGGFCPEMITRVYRVLDSDENATTCEQEIIFIDLTPPIATGPAPQVIPESEIESSFISDYSKFISIGGTATDNCGIDESNIKFLSEIEAGNVCNTIFRVYSVYDLCGNSATVEQVLHIELTDEEYVDFDNTYDNKTVDFVHNISFTNINSYQWSFGDGSTSDEENPTHLYDEFGVFEVCLDVHTNCGSKNKCKFIEVKNLDALSELETTNKVISLYPNPVTDQLTITIQENFFIEKTSILDVSGKIIYESSLQNSNRIQNINTSQWVEGVYIVQVKGKQGVISKKFIKK